MREEELRKRYGTEEGRFQEAICPVVKSMLKCFPKLRERVKKPFFKLQSISY